MRFHGIKEGFIAAAKPSSNHSKIYHELLFFNSMIIHILKGKGIFFRLPYS